MSSHRIKNNLIKNGIKEHKCEKCNLTEWNGVSIPIELHHVDGDHSNNNENNLMILCPNCHAQTDTYKSRNKKTGKHGVGLLDEEIIPIINDSYSITEVLKKFKMKRSPYFRNRCKILLIDKKAQLKIRPRSPNRILDKKTGRIKQVYYCCDCGCEKSRDSTRCKNCRMIHTKSLVKPPKDILIMEIENMGYLKVGKNYGVTDNTVRKWVKGYGLDPKDIGYKAKREH